MRTFDPSILSRRNRPPGVLTSLMQGMDEGRAERKERSELQELAGRRKKRDQDERRAQSFESNLSGLMNSYGDFAYTPEGRESLLKDLASGGFGREALALGRDMDPLMREPKKFTQEQEPWEIRTGVGPDGREVDYQYRKSDPAGTAKPLPYGPKAKEVAAPKEETWDKVETEEGYIDYVNPATGLNREGKRVKFYKNPNSGQPPRDRFTTQTIGGRKVQINEDTKEKVDLGPSDEALSRKFQQENTLRDEYKKGVEKFETAFPAYGKLQQALQRNNPTDAYSAVINFVRTLDPQSTVREAEEKLARMRSAGGYWGSLAQEYFNVVDGKMTDKVRKNLLEAGKGLVQQEYDQYSRVRKDVKDQTLNYPDPTGEKASLDTLNTIGRGRDSAYHATVNTDIFAKPPKAGAAGFKVQGKVVVNPTESDLEKMTNQELQDYLSGKAVK